VQDPGDAGVVLGVLIVVGVCAAAAGNLGQDERVDLVGKKYVSTSSAPSLTFPH
jgi:hypothetical protein